MGTVAWGGGASPARRRWRRSGIGCPRRRAVLRAPAPHRAIGGTNQRPARGKTRPGAPRRRRRTRPRRALRAVPALEGATRMTRYTIAAREALYDDIWFKSTLEA